MPVNEAEVSGEPGRPRPARIQQGAAKDRASQLSLMMSAAPHEAIPDGLPGRWWVAHTKPRQEKALAADLWSTDVQPYVPLGVRVTRSRKTGRTSKSTIPIFPGYLFFCGTQQDRERALKTQRIVTVLSVHDQDQLIDELRQIHRILSSGRGYQTHQSVKVGQVVKILNGPLMGLQGIVSGRRSSVRFVLNVHMLGQSVIVDISIDDIEAIDTSP